MSAHERWHIAIQLMLVQELDRVESLAKALLLTQQLYDFNGVSDKDRELLDRTSEQLTQIGDDLFELTRTFKSMGLQASLDAGKQISDRLIEVADRTGVALEAVRPDSERMPAVHFSAN